MEDTTIPFDSFGNYSLPAIYLAEDGRTILSAQHNSPLEDLQTAQNSLVLRSGVAAMTGQHKLFAGTVAAPGLAFNSNANTGWYKTSTGWAFAVAGVRVAEFGAGGLIYGGVPIGAGMDFWGSTAPAGWMFAYGQAVSRTTYSSLFTQYGTTYGVGDGSTTFNVMDKRGRASFGKDDMGGSAANRITTAGAGLDGLTLGAVGGAQTVTIAQANLPNVSFTNSGIAVALTNSTVTIPLHTTTISASNGAAAAQGVNGPETSLAADSGVVGVSVTNQGSAASGGSGTALNKLPPGIVCNYIIFAGA